MKNKIESLDTFIADKQYRYYYSTLSPNLKEAYTTLLEGYLSHKQSIEIKVSSADEASLVHDYVFLDVPELFYINKEHENIYFLPFLLLARITPEYRFDHNTCLTILSEMAKVSEPLLSQIAMLSEREKIKEIHDYMIQSATYKDLDKPYSHESPGIILYGIAVCEGFSKTFKYLADRAGIKSIVIFGDSLSGTDADPSWTAHAWNIVYIGLITYHLDVTFDYSFSKNNYIRYDYFLLSDFQIQKDHLFERTPMCKNNYEYYCTNGHYADNQQKLKKLAKEELRIGRPLTVKVPDFTQNADSLADIMLQTVQEAISAIDRFYSRISMSYNRSRLVFRFDIN